MRDDNKLYLFTTSLLDQNDIDRQFNNWWQKSSKEYFTKALNELYPIVKKHGIQQPEIVVKKMKTLWGSCSRKHGKVKLNFYLQVLWCGVIKDHLTV